MRGDSTSHSDGEDLMFFAVLLSQADTHAAPEDRGQLRTYALAPTLATRQKRTLSWLAVAAY